jgi:hypothetical protein
MNRLARIITAILVAPIWLVSLTVPATERENAS